jgi:hypothetical protein
MVQILGICSSPVKDSNTECILKEAFDTGLCPVQLVFAEARRRKILLY